MPWVKPTCMVPSCRKEQDKDKFPDESFFVLPRQADLRGRWLEAVKVDGSIISPTSRHYRVCQDHFLKSDIERDLRSELLGLKRPKMLKPGTVPSLLLPPALEKPSADGQGSLGVKVEIENHEEEEGVGDRAKRASRRALAKKQPCSTKKIERIKPHFGCLICSKSPVDKNYSERFIHPGANNHGLLNKQLWNLFVLQHALNVPIIRIKQILEKFGNTRNPESWFHLCSKCSPQVAQAMKIQQELLRLRLKLDTIFGTLRKKAKTTVELDKETLLTKSEVEIELWSIIRELNGVIPRPTEEVSLKNELLSEDEPFEEISRRSPRMTGDSNNEYNDIASRIDRILQQNAAVVGEPLSRPAGFDSDSGCSDNDDDPLSEEKCNEIRTVVQRKVAKTVVLKTKLKNTKTAPSSDGVAKNIKTSIKSTKPIILRSVRSHERKLAKLTCGSCPAVFCTKELYLQHNENHQRSKENGNKFDCKFCGWVIPNDQLLKQHQLMRHNYNGNAIVLGEGKKSVQRVAQETPNAEDTNSTTTEGENKPKDSNEQCLYNSFIKQVTASDSVLPRGRFKFSYEHCPFCCARYTSLLDYENHLAVHEKNAEFGLELNCPHQHCALPFQNEKALTLHLRHVHKDNVMNTCESCGFTVSKVFKRRWESHLIKHKLEESRTTDSGLFGCTTCDKNFITMKLLIRHKKATHADELGLDCFLCSDCPRTFLTKSGLESHEKLFHSSPDLLVEQCDVCGEAFPTPTLLNKHMKKHEEKKHICDRCGGEYSSLANLNEHKRRMYGEPVPRFQQRYNSRKPQRCKHCHIMLPHLAALRRHVKIHAAINCDNCGNNFLTKDDLIKHKELVHKSSSGGTKKKCQYCGKVFKHRISVYGHYYYCKAYKKVEGGIGERGALQCPTCKRSFRHKRAIAGHAYYCKKANTDADKQSNNVNSDSDGQPASADSSVVAT